MSPSFERGSLLLIESKPAKDLKNGDILFFRVPGDSEKNISHRIIKIEKQNNTTFFKTKGDANTTADPWKFSLKSDKAWVVTHSIDKVAYLSILLSEIPSNEILIFVISVIMFIIGVIAIWKKRNENLVHNPQLKYFKARTRISKQTITKISSLISLIVIVSIGFSLNTSLASFTSGASTSSNNPSYQSGLLNSPLNPTCSWTNSLTTLTFNWTNSVTGQQNNTELLRSTTSGGALTSMSNYALPTSTGSNAPSPVTSEWFYKLRATKTGATNWSSSYTSELRSDRCKYAIDAYAGTGGTGSTGDGGLATAATFSSPRGIGIDSSDNVYVADSANKKIRKITVSTGIITTVAGNGTAGFLGDGGLATAARLNAPSDVAVAANGDMYIADTGNSRIRKVTAVTGIITTFAGTGTVGNIGDGGLATAARLSTPTNVLINGNNLYIYNTGTTANTRIRVVDLTSNIITLVAGGGANTSCAYTGSATATALLSSAAQGGGMAIDGTGNLYISDSGRNCIRRRDAATGNMSLFAGTGTAGSTTTCTTGVAPTAINISTPREIDIDASGNIYFSITQPFCVYKITGGLAQKVAGVGTTGDTGDNGPALAASIRPVWGLELDSLSNLYFVQSASNFRLREIFGPLP